MKPIWQSKTFWLGLLGTIAGTLEYLGGSQFVQQYPQVAAGIMTVVGVLTIILRIFTTVPVSLTAQTPEDGAGQ